MPIFKAKNKDFLQVLWESLKSQGIKGGYIYNKNSRGFELVFSWLKGLDLCRLMYDNLESAWHLNRKYKIYQKALTII